MENNKIYTNHSLDEYKQKYKYKKLKTVSKDAADAKPELLGKKNWWLINGNYYEVPKAPSFNWFRNLNAGIQIGCCLLGAGAITTAIAVPLYFHFNKASELIVDIDASCSDLATVESKQFDKNGNASIIIKSKEDKDISRFAITIGDIKLTKDTDYSIKEQNSIQKFEILIFKQTLTKYKGKIIIKPIVAVYYKVDWNTTKHSEWGNKTVRELIRTVGEWVEDQETHEWEWIESYHGADAISLIYSDELTINEDEVNIGETDGDKVYAKWDEASKSLTIRSYGEICFNDNDIETRVDPEYPEYPWTEGYFCECKNLKTIDLSNINTSNATDLSTMFQGCENLETLKYLNNIDTSKGINLSSMFSGCRKLKTIDLSNFKTSNVTDISYMFYNCDELTTVDFSSIDSSNITNMDRLFDGCNKLQTIDLTPLGKSKLTSLYGLFNACYELTEIKGLNTIDTSNVTDMKYLFDNCNKLSTIDLSNFNTSNVQNMSYMFQFCKELKTIYVSQDFVTTNVTESNYMFSGCNKLEGGSGTKWNDNNPKDKTYARIDGGSVNPGYFTEKK